LVEAHILGVGVLALQELAWKGEGTDVGAGSPWYPDYHGASVGAGSTKVESLGPGQRKECIPQATVEGRW